MPQYSTLYANHIITPNLRRKALAGHNKSSKSDENRPISVHKHPTVQNILEGIKSKQNCLSYKTPDKCLNNRDNSLTFDKGKDTSLLSHPLKIKLKEREKYIPNIENMKNS